MIIEGQEKDDFWALLGGKGPYSNSPRLVEENEERAPRLFQCSNASGVFTVNEIVEFGQVTCGLSVINPALTLVCLHHIVYVVFYL